MANGIGSYYSPQPLRPVATQGIGSYYSPNPLLPVGETIDYDGSGSSSSMPVLIAFGMAALVGLALLRRS